MPKPALNDELRRRVMLRSGHRCEYCQSQDRFSPVFFTIDHVVPLFEGGSGDFENLAYACSLCNRLKWQKTSAIDPVTQLPAPLFNPRTQTWRDHFRWSGDFLEILGISATGRATVAALSLNREKLVRYRREMFEIGQHPPK